MHANLIRARCWDSARYSFLSFFGSVYVLSNAKTWQWLATVSSHPEPNGHLLWQKLKTFRSFVITQPHLPAATGHPVKENCSNSFMFSITSAPELMANIWSNVCWIYYYYYYYFHVMLFGKSAHLDGWMDGNNTVIFKAMLFILQSLFYILSWQLFVAFMYI